MLLVVALVALAVAVTAYVVLRTAETPNGAEPADAGPDSPDPTLVQSPAATGAGPPAVLEQDGKEFIVDVAGKVHRPGITTLAAVPVADALKKAGGPRGGVDLSALDLARVLVDGEQILIGRQSQRADDRRATGRQQAPALAPDPGGALVDIDAATSERLDTLPGIGPVTAQKILDWRSSHGAFSSVDSCSRSTASATRRWPRAPHVTL